MQGDRMAQEWLVDESGLCLPLLTQASEPEALDVPYRLYRLLTDLEDVLRSTANPTAQLQKITPLVRRLLDEASWLEVMPIVPNPETGWEVVTLYDEPMFPLTVQMVAWAPGSESPIHNHACWGVVALLSGAEQNTFWRREPTAELPDRIVQAGGHQLQAGEIITFLPDAIHQIQALGNRPTISFNLYGETDYDRRFEFNPAEGTASVF
jgi:predicted metal-dependent enzyme (double-stranded beta helix superfamily)